MGNRSLPITIGGPLPPGKRAGKTAVDMTGITMTKDNPDQGLKLYSRALYSIQIQGVLDPSWSNRLNGMQIFNTVSSSQEHPGVTTLIGEVADQAALAGILSAVYGLCYPLLSVTYLGRPNGAEVSA